MKKITENLPTEVSESESFKSMNAQVESFLKSCVTEATQSNSSLPPKAAGQRKSHSKTVSVSEFNEKVYHGSDDHLNEAGISDTSPDTEGAAQPRAESGSRSGASTSGGPKEVMEQFEPGVYVTLLQLGNGTKIFKRVRFRYNS